MASRVSSSLRAEAAARLQLPQGDIDETLRPQGDQVAALIPVAAVAVPGLVVVAGAEILGGQVAQAEHPERFIPGGGQVVGVQQEGPPHVDVQGGTGGPGGYFEILDLRQVGAGVQDDGGVVTADQLLEHGHQLVDEFTAAYRRYQAGQVGAELREGLHVENLPATCSWSAAIIA